MGDTVVGHGPDGRVAENGFTMGFGRRVAVICRFHVREQVLSNLRQLGDEAACKCMRAVFAIYATIGFRFVAYKTVAAVDLICQVTFDSIKLGADVIGHGVRRHLGRPIVTGKEHRAEVLDNPREHFYGRHGRVFGISV